MRILNSFEETGFCFVRNCGEVLPSLVEFGKFGTILNIHFNCTIFGQIWTICAVSRKRIFLVSFAAPFATFGQFGLFEAV